MWGRSNFTADLHLWLFCHVNGKYLAWGSVNYDRLTPLYWWSSCEWQIPGLKQCSNIRLNPLYWCSSCDYSVVWIANTWPGEAFKHERLTRLYGWSSCEWQIPGLKQCSNIRDSPLCTWPGEAVKHERLTPLYWCSSYDYSVVWIANTWPGAVNYGRLMLQLCV